MAEEISVLREPLEHDEWFTEGEDQWVYVLAAHVAK
jgi:hypothetical protein